MFVLLLVSAIWFFLLDVRLFVFLFLVGFFFFVRNNLIVQLSLVQQFPLFP